MVEINLKDRKAYNFPKGWVGIFWGKKNRIVYTTGILTFTSSKEEKRFLDTVIPESKLQWIEVDLLKSNPPEKRSRAKGIYCPYCKQQEYWKSTPLGRVCPICGISDHDYYVRQYNYLWGPRYSTKELKIMDKRQIKRRK